MRARLAAGAVLGMLATGASAYEGDFFTPFAAWALAYDSNVFRLSDESDPLLVLGTPHRSDAIASLIAGGAVDWRISRQHLRANARVSSNDYRRFDDLDNHSYELSAGWDWEIGDDWQGLLSASETRQLAGFQDIQQFVRNERTTRNAGAEARYLLDARWRLRARADTVSTRNDNPQRAGDDVDETSFEAGAGYELPTGSRIGAGVRWADGETGGAAGSVRQQYSQVGLRGYLEWRRSPYAVLRFGGGPTRRTYDNLGSSDYKGFTGDLSYEWRPTAKLLVNLAARQDVTTYEDVSGGAATARSLTLSPTWYPTATLQVQATAGWVWREFREVVIGTGELRQDDTWTLGANVRYAPLRWLAIVAGAGIDRRDSNQRFTDYDARFASLSVQGSF